MARFAPLVVFMLLISCGPATPPEQVALVEPMRELADAYATAPDDRAEREILAAMAELDPHHPQIYASILIKHWPRERERVLDRMPRRGTEGGPGFRLAEAWVALFGGRTDASEEATLRALEGYRARNHLAGIATSRNNLANVALRREDWDAALHHGEAARALQLRLGDEYNAREVTKNLARARIGGVRACLADSTCGDPLERAERALAEAERSDDPAMSGSARFVRGRALLAADRAEEALEEFRRASDLHERAGRSGERIAADGKIGLALLEIGRYREAERALEDALDSAMTEGQHELAAGIRLDLSNLALSIGEADRAVDLLDTVLRWAEEADHGYLRIAALGNLGIAYYRAGDPDSARDYAIRGLQEAERSGDRLVAGRARNVLAASLAALGRPAEALAEYDRAIETLEPVRPVEAALARVNSARALDRLGRIEQAANRAADGLRRLRRGGDPEDVAFALNLAGEMDRKCGRLREALRRHRAARELARSLHRWDLRTGAHWGLGETYRDLERWDAADEALREAIDSAELERTSVRSAEWRTHFFRDRVRLYEDALFVREAAGRLGPEEAFDLFERSRARAFLDRWSATHGGARAHLPPEVRRRERELLDDLSAAAVRLRRARGRGERAEASEAVLAAERGLSAFRAERALDGDETASVLDEGPETLEAVRSVLRPGELLLAYFVGEEASWRLTIDREEARVDRVPPGAELVALADDLLAAAEGSGPGSEARGRRAAVALGSAILPVSFGPEARRLIVVADGVLHRVPFDGLIRDDVYLVERYETVAVPSASALRRMRDSAGHRGTGGFLGIGAPEPDTLEDDRFPALPFARAALFEIGDRFPRDRRSLLVGAAASESALRTLPLDRFRWMHVATHGWIDSERPRHSGLILSPDPDGTGDGFLHLDEIVTLPLDVDLVVLAACRTAVGELLRGEGFVSLNRAFLHAGADAVLATLWNVSDRSTAEFMVRFYDELALDEDPVAALRRTKLAFLRSDRPARRQLYRWAPFVVTGDPPVARSPDGSR